MYCFGVSPTYFFRFVVAGEGNSSVAHRCVLLLQSPDGRTEPTDLVPLFLLFRLVCCHEHLRAYAHGVDEKVFIRHVRFGSTWNFDATCSTLCKEAGR